MEKQSPTCSTPPHRVAFYPCCCGDVEEPRRFLAPYVDEILFCDLKRSGIWDNVQDEPGLPKATFLKGDVRDIIGTLEHPLKVLFYRNDSNAEGGSGVRILGKDLLPRILQQFDPQGGWIFSDGSNGGKTFRLLCSVDWHSKPGWGFQFREVDRSLMGMGDFPPMHVVEVRPFAIQEPSTRPGWVEPTEKRGADAAAVHDEDTTCRQQTPATPAPKPETETLVREFENLN